MKGIIFSQLEDVVGDLHGPDNWHLLLSMQPGAPGCIFRLECMAPIALQRAGSAAA